ncbi:MAG: hypothetical protein JEZ14_07955 [Marinilabiliaceae bacterium]|nr:hypothetical protein [Marinilabiliaceae bacterium]
MNQFNTPILFLIFNRPDTTKQVFERIKEVKPKFLFIAADGARENKIDEKKLCNQTREIVIDNIDWPCEVKTLIRTQNLGCGKAVSEAITWFFDNVEMGIILEDDCLPEIDFFYFCNELLKKYRFNEKIYSIGGTNVLLNWKDDNQSYHFSYQGSIWGWATWKRAWNKYQFILPATLNDKAIKTLKEISFNSAYFKIRKDIFEKVKNIDTWDYQWAYTRLSNKGLSILPSKNLITNIGFGTNATHTTDDEHKLAQLKSFQLNKPLKHLDKIKLDKKFEKKFLNFLYSQPKENNKLNKAKALYTQLKSLYK